MGTLTIMEKGASCHDVIDWPAFYMNDFSVLGLLVDNLYTTSALLRSHGYNVFETKCSVQVGVDNTDHYKNIFTILDQNRVKFVSADLVGCAYQG